jgi:geranylgeranyl diphosphate/geranylgeranyl-bacteriochlorophyllide a reductase
VDLKKATADLRASAGLTECETIRKEGAPIPLKPLDRWDNGRDVVLAGDAAGVVAPSSGEGIYYAMVGGQVAATAAQAALASGRAKDLALARKLFMKEHKRSSGCCGRCRMPITSRTSGASGSCRCVTMSTCKS